MHILDRYDDRYDLLMSSYVQLGDKCAKLEKEKKILQGKAVKWENSLKDEVHSLRELIISRTSGSESDSGSDPSSDSSATSDSDTTDGEGMLPKPLRGPMGTSPKGFSAVSDCSSGRSKSRSSDKNKKSKKKHSKRKSQTHVHSPTRVQGGKEPKRSEGKLPVYDGKCEWDSYCYQVEAIAESMGWSEKVLMGKLVTALREKALEMYKNLFGKRSKLPSYLEVKETLGRFLDIPDGCESVRQSEKGRQASSGKVPQRN